MIRIAQDFPLTAGIVIFEVSEICGWWVLVDGVVAGVERVDSQQEIRRGIFQ
jgi:hypothetical protein